MDKIDYEAKLAAEVAKLSEYQKALEAEHKLITSEASDGQPDLKAADVYKAAEQKLLAQVGKAADTVVSLLEFADKDATRFSVARYVLDLANTSKSGTDEHPFEEILRKIGAKQTDETTD